MASTDNKVQETDADDKVIVSHTIEDSGGAYPPIDGDSPLIGTSMNK